MKRRAGGCLWAAGGGMRILDHFPAEDWPLEWHWRNLLDRVGAESYSREPTGGPKDS
jgi:hypothetical protein